MNRVYEADEADYIAVVEYDSDTEDPTEYGMVRYLPVNSSWPNDTYELSDCSLCGAESDHDLHDPDSPYRAMMHIHKFQWQPWAIETITSSPFREDLPKDYDDLFDRGGFTHLVYVPPENREEWLALDEKAQEENLRATYDTWDTWRNGECYWVRIERPVLADCVSCQRKLPDEDVDSLAGLIGDDAVQEYIAEIVGDSPVYIKE
jgi:hypothetical protein